MLTTVSLVTSITIQSYYNITDNNPYAVYYTAVTYLFYKWRSVPLNPLHLLCPQTSSSGHHPFIFYELCFCFLDSICMWDHMVSSFSDLFHFSLIPSRSICVVTYGNISFFFNGWVIFHCVEYICIYILTYVSICMCCVCLVTQICLTLCNLIAVASQDPLSMGILQARILEWVAMHSSRGSSQPRDRTQVFRTAGGTGMGMATHSNILAWRISMDRGAWWATVSPLSFHLLMDTQVASISWWL